MGPRGRPAARGEALSADRVAPPGTLVLVSTPIGNLGDLSERAREALATADLVACEDTRRTGRLLHHLGIGDRRLLRLDAHREEAAAGRVVDVLAGGGRVALVSDAGTPSVSDPGQRLVDHVLDAGHEVRAVPGPSAVLAALVVSGLPIERFVFEGFLPRRGPERATRIGQLVVEPRTSVIFESPHRAAATLAELADACGPERPVAVCRELTKLHEEVWRGPLGEASAAAETVKGEVVVVLGGVDEPTQVDEGTIRAALDEAIAGGRSRRDAVREVASRLGVARNVVYDLATETS
ncbi:MAG: 16S rRNA (cytidine(1402)-2'-O)-methyltransferase [Actinomycetota bacterium]